MPVEQTADMNQSAYSPYTAAPSAAPPPLYGAPNLSVSPGLAFILGLIPGVGAIYNGQYAKGLIHVLILGTLISFASSGGVHGSGEPLFGLMISAFFFYMAFEAYHTAKKRQLGQPVDEFSSLFPLKRSDSRFPIVPVLFIAIGVLFLLNNFDLLRIRDVARFWPVFLIGLGAYMLWVRLTGGPVNPEAANEQR